MSITYYHEKKISLTPEEVDQNFHELEDRLARVFREKGKHSDLKLSVHDGQLNLAEKDGDLLASCPLPQSTWTPRGIWKSDTLYQRNDLIFEETEKQTGLFLALRTHKSQDLRDYDESAWTCIFRMAYQDARSLPSHAGRD